MDIINSTAVWEVDDPLMDLSSVSYTPILTNMNVLTIQPDERGYRTLISNLVLSVESLSAKSSYSFTLRLYLPSGENAWSSVQLKRNTPPGKPSKISQLFPK